MKKLLLPLVLSGLLQACGSQDHSTEHVELNETQEETSSDLHLSLGDRFYTLAFPAGGLKEGKAYKLLFAFHGSGGTEQGMQRMTRFELLSDDYLVIYPKSKEVEWDEGCECNIAHRLGAKDVEFIVQLIDKMHAEYNLLEGENYAVGFSQGGLFSQNMLCKFSEKFQAVASVASPMSDRLSIMCSITDPTSYMLVQGTADRVLPYRGLVHLNFGLISAPKAVELISSQTIPDAIVSENMPSEHVTEKLYRSSTDTKLLSKLVSIDGGGHAWSFENYSTSNQLLDFFNQSSMYALPEYSALYTVNTKNYHVRSMGKQTDKGDVVILSGANKFFHSDSAWASLIQPLLSKHARVHVIDRLGNAWSSDVEEPSFKQLADDLPELLSLLGTKKVTFLSFANSNLATLMYLHNPNPEIKVNGVVWADPDILLPHSIAQYQSGSVAALRKYKTEYIEHVRGGNWTEKSRERIAIEREELVKLISSNHQETMDWVYYDQVTEQRLKVENQVTRIKEMMNYHDDLNIAEPLQHNISVPISVIDSDFERLDIANANEDEKPSLVQWQQEGTQWSKDIAYKTQGNYYELKNASHQVFFEHPDTVVKAVLERLERND
ncbi:alpha/beta hydrolase [Pseudoalteromonas sp. MTN2-4]|uniref:alpha/beta hydrolase n=1 Tax=Pseudoalteromonas sp. MTN2-4 TaxID=3056555 RepID=UPI0036F35B19